MQYMHTYKCRYTFKFINIHFIHLYYNIEYYKLNNVYEIMHYNAVKSE